MCAAYAPTEQQRRRPVGNQTESTPAFVLMNDIMDKLKILNYETNFIVPNCFFAVPASNPQEQFYYLRCLMEWLADMAGFPFPARASMDDDINASASVMSAQLRKAGCTSDISPNSLKMAHGEAVCAALNYLCDLAMKRTSVVLTKPEFIEDPNQDDLVEEDNGDDDDEEIGDDDIVEDDDDGMGGPPSAAGVDDFGAHEGKKPSSDEKTEKGTKKKKDKSLFGSGFDLDDEEEEEDEESFDRIGRRPGSGFGLGRGLLEKDELLAFGKGPSAQSENALQSKGPRLVFAPRSRFDPAQWRYEAERVAPQLKTRRGGDVGGKDWYARLEETKQQLRQLAQARRQVVGEMAGVVREIEAEMEKIRSRERFFNQDCRPLLEEYKKEATTLKALSTQSQQQEKEVEALTQELNEATEQVDAIKGEMEEHAESSSNTAPLMRMKEAQTRLQEELKQIRVRIATLQHYLLQTKKEDLEEKKTSTTSSTRKRDKPSVIPQGGDDDSDESDEEL